MLTNEISQSLYAKTSYLTNPLEEEIRRIQKLQYECLNDEILFYSISAFPIMTKSEKLEKLLDMQKRLKILHESSIYIDEVYVDIPELGRRDFLSGRGGAGKGSGRGICGYPGKIQEFHPFYDWGSMYMAVSLSL